MKISIIGAGNMAHQLGKALVDARHDVVDVYNRTYSKAQTLAPLLKAKAQKDIGQLRTHVAVLIIAVSDDAIAKIAGQLIPSDWKDTVVVHTSGSVSSDVLSVMKKYGSFYPFQSMTAGQKMNFSRVPVLISANEDGSRDVLFELASSISDQVHKINDEQRAVVHVAGVFANNFTNQMIALSKNILDKNELPFGIVKPLIMNTIGKLSELNPMDAQTGPAVRGDQQTIDKHIDFLQGNPDLQELYNVVSQSIIALHKSEG